MSPIICIALSVIHGVGLQNISVYNGAIKCSQILSRWSSDGGLISRAFVPHPAGGMMAARWSSVLRMMAARWSSVLRMMAARWSSVLRILSLD